MLDDSPVTLQDITAASDVPERFTRLVIGQLKKARYVEPTGQPDDWRLTEFGASVFETFRDIVKRSQADMAVPGVPGRDTGVAFSRRPVVDKAPSNVQDTDHVKDNPLLRPATPSPPGQRQVDVPDQHGDRPGQGRAE